jgi:hypothetical protein
MKFDYCKCVEAVRFNVFGVGFEFVVVGQQQDLLGGEFVGNV